MSAAPPAPADEPGPSVAELAAEPSLALRLLLPGSPGGRAVRWAHATELLDPAPYLRGGELVCTVGQAFDDDAACAAFAASVAAAGAVGICFGTGDVVDDVPPALVAACAELGLALLAADRGTPFMALTEHLAARRVRQAVAGSRAGQLLELLADRAVAAEALLPALVDAGLGRGHLCASAWPAGCAPELLRAVGGAAHLVSAGDAEVLLVTAADADDLAPAGSPLPVRGSAGASSWRELGTALRRARSQLAASLASADAASRHDSPGSATLAGLLAAQPPGALAPFVEQLLRPLLDADRRRDGGLVITLRAYLTADGSLVEVARTQYLHVNSVRHRLARVRDLTGTDPTTLDGAAAFRIALWARQYHHESPQKPR